MKSIAVADLSTLAFAWAAGVWTAVAAYFIGRSLALRQNRKDARRER